MLLSRLGVSRQSMLRILLLLVLDLLRQMLAERLLLSERLDWRGCMILCGVGGLRDGWRKRGV